MDFLKDRDTNPGETVEYGFFLFLIVDGDNNLDTLDFKKMASFTSNFDFVENIHESQMDTLKQNGLEPNWCNLRQSLTISKSLDCNSKDVFMNRDEPVSATDSGWFVGPMKDSIDVNDPVNLKTVSIYEISLECPQLLPFWLFPTSHWIRINEEGPEVHVKL